MPLSRRRSRRTSPYTQSAITYFNAMPTQPTAAEKRLVDTFVRAGQARGWWPVLDTALIMALGTVQQCLVDLKVPSRVATVYATPSYIFTANRQFMSDGNTDTVNLPASIQIPWNPSTAGGNYTDDSAHLALWRIQNGGTVSTRNLGGISAGNDLIILARSTGDNFIGRVNFPTNDTYLAGSNDGNGFFLLSRTADAVSYGQWNATQGSDVITASTGMPNGNLRALQCAGVAAGLSTEGLSLISAGGGMTKPIGLLYNADVAALINGLRAL